MSPEAKTPPTSSDILKAAEVCWFFSAHHPSWRVFPDAALALEEEARVVLNYEIEAKRREGLTLEHPAGP